MSKRVTIVQQLELALLRFQDPVFAEANNLFDAVCLHEFIPQTHEQWLKCRKYVVAAAGLDPDKFGLTWMAHNLTTHQQHVALTKAIRHAKSRHPGGKRYAWVSE